MYPIPYNRTQHLHADVCQDEKPGEGTKESPPEAQPKGNNNPRHTFWPVEACDMLRPVVL